VRGIIESTGFLCDAEIIKKVLHAAGDSLKYFVAHSDLDRTFENIDYFVFVAVHMKLVSAFGVKLKKVIKLVILR
jgi:hypothetical protein